MPRNKYNVDEELNESFNKAHLVRILQYVKPYKKEMTTTLVVMILSSIAGLVGPILVKNAIDVKIPGKDILGLLELALIYLFLIVFAGFGLKYRIKKMTQVGHQMVATIRSDLFSHLQKLPFTYFDSRPHGKIIVRVVNYVNSLSNLLSSGIINFFVDLLSLAIIVVFMLLVDVKLTFIGLGTLPLLIAFIFIIKKSQRRRWQTVSAKSSNMNAYINESINGIKVTQSFNREDENQRIFDEVTDDYRMSWMKAVRVNNLFWPVVDNIANLGTTLVIVAGIYWFTGSMTIGTLIAFIGYLGSFWAPITNISNFYNQIITAMAYLERIFEMMDEDVVVRDERDSYDLPKIEGNITFENITFSYDNDINILENLNLKAEKGESIAIVGPTGAGKTTIVNLLSRFYNINSGRILIDGHDISKVTLKSLRSQMGIMMQDSFLFSGTIMENVRYGKLDATDEEIIEACKTVKAHDFISQMKNGYHTEINEKGTRLSFGQRQLIAFARTLLKDPRILILDEATSSIDTETEKALQEGLENLLKGRTSFIIAHRLSTIKNASKIIYVDNRNIVEEGHHMQLMQRAGAYWRLFMSQYNSIKESGTLQD